MLKQPEPRNKRWSVAEAGYSAPYLYLLEEDRTPSSQALSTYSKRKLDQVTRAIREGSGQGRGENFSPWIRITRRFSSPVSYMEFASVSVHRRNHHFLSRLEHQTGLLLAYLGARELRECLPMWPTPHPHPWLDSRGEVAGLMSIATDAGIEHGTFIGTDVPYVGSLDMLAEVPWRGRIHHLGVSCKPAQILAMSRRAKERVKLDRFYCREIGAVHVIEDGMGFDQTLLSQLASYRPLYSEILKHRGTARLDDFSGVFEQIADALPLHVAISASRERVGLSHQDGSLFWRLAVWLHLIDIDLSKPLVMRQPIRRGQRAVLQRLANRYLGERS